MPDELVGGIMCKKYTYTKKHGHTMDDNLSFYWDPVLEKPVRWHQHSRSLPFGSHTDEYIIDYLSFQPGTPSEKDLDLDPLCKQPVVADVSSRAEGVLAAMHNNRVSNALLQSQGKATHQQA